MKCFAQIIGSSMKVCASKLFEHDSSFRTGLKFDIFAKIKLHFHLDGYAVVDEVHLLVLMI